MLDCLILGDSIAKGVSDIRKECVAYVKNGINSHDYVNRLILNTKGDTTAKTIIISLGSNDSPNVETFEELDTMRQLIKADVVWWILPNIKETKRNDVWEVAKKHNDKVLDSRAYDRSPDHIHPTYNGYREMAKDIK
jgi:lysophospholipase L1-like esterase